MQKFLYLHVNESVTDDFETVVLKTPTEDNVTQAAPTVMLYSKPVSLPLVTYPNMVEFTFVISGESVAIKLKSVG